MADALSALLLYGITFIVFGIPSYVIFWKLYIKAGQAGWKSIIPFYSQYTMGVIAKKPNVAIIAVAASVAYSVLSALNIKALAIALFAVFIAYVGTGLYVLSQFIRQYDAGIGKWILFIFFPYIGVFLVGSVKYKGATTPPQNPVTPAAPAITPTVTPPTPPAQPVNPAPRTPAAPAPGANENTPPQPPTPGASL